MTATTLEKTARALVAPGKGILAADESTGTIKKRLASVGVESTEETRRSYREMLFTTEGAEEHISGVILFDETIRQSAADGTPFPEVLKGKGIIPGIKVDKGAKPLAFAEGEKVTEGLDGLRDRLAEYRELGARFTKWRAVITIGDSIPSELCIDANAHGLARFAALSQEAGLVPIVEPEVLMDGDHSIQRCQEVTRATLDHVFQTLALHRVSFSGMLLKPNMVISGKAASDRAGVEEVARRTVELFREVVPPEVPGIVFLSGGQSEEEASAHLSAMNELGDLPWELSFSYGRALQGSALEAWSGHAENTDAGREAFLHRARLNGEARFGRYTPEMEREVA